MQEESTCSRYTRGELYYSFSLHRGYAAHKTTLYPRCTRTQISSGPAGSNASSRLRQRRSARSHRAKLSASQTRLSFQSLVSTFFFTRFAFVLLMFLLSRRSELSYLFQSAVHAKRTRRYTSIDNNNNTCVHTLMLNHTRQASLSTPAHS
jgi:hypothetical protein